jgi:hypothetical protein
MALHDTNGHAHKITSTTIPIHNKVAVGEDDCCFFAYAMEVIPMVGERPDLRRDEGTVLLIDKAFQGGGGGGSIVHRERVFGRLIQ